MSSDKMGEKNIMSFIPANNSRRDEALESKLAFLGTEQFHDSVIQVYGFGNASELKSYLTTLSEKHPNSYILTADQKNLTLEVSAL